MNGSIHILNFLKEICSVKEKMDENQINKLREIQNSVSDELKKQYPPLETFLHFTDMLFEVNEREYSFRKRIESSRRLKFNIFFRYVKIFDR